MNLITSTNPFKHNSAINNNHFYYCAKAKAKLRRLLGTKWLEPKWLEPQRIDQVLTKSLRDRMRPENLPFIFVCANLHHQKPVGCSPFIPFSTDCTPPAAVLLSGQYPPKKVLQRKTVAMQPDVRQCNSSTSTNWRNDSPQEVRAFSQYFSYMPNRPASSFTTFSLPSHDERQNPATSHRFFTWIDGAIFVRTSGWPFQKATFHRPRSVTYRCDFKQSRDRHNRQPRSESVLPPHNDDSRKKCANVLERSKRRSTISLAIFRCRTFWGKNRSTCNFIPGIEKRERTPLPLR